MMKLLYQGLMEFMCKELYDCYFQDGNILAIHRDFIQGVLFMQQDVEEETIMEIKLVILLCKLVDGVDCLMEYDDRSETLLELALEDIEELVHNYGEHLHLVAELKQAIMRQAVFVCIRKGEYELGSKVLVRLYNRSQNIEEKAFLSKLKKVVSGRDLNHPATLSHCFSEIHQAVIATFSTLLSSMEEPFLLKACHDHMRRLNSDLQEETEEEEKEQIFRTEMVLPNTALCKALNITHEKTTILNKSVDIKEFSDIRKELQKNRENYLSDIPPLLQGMGLEDLKKDGGHHFGKQKSPVKRRRPRTGQTSSKKRKTTEVEPPTKKRPTQSKDDSLVTRLGGQRPPEVHVRRSLKMHIIPPTLIIYNKWSEEEEEQLYLGLQKYGPGKWRMIQNEYVQTRTNVQLKDKHRTWLGKQQYRLAQLEDQFGPLKCT